SCSGDAHSSTLKRIRALDEPRDSGYLRDAVFNPRARRLIVLGIAALATVHCGAICPVTIGDAERRAFLAVKPDEGYVIDPSDQLQIEVWQNQQLTRPVTVRPDGKITLPLLDEVAAAGQTVPQFQAELAQRLKTFIKEPVVSVTVTSFGSKRPYILGQ